MNLLRSMVLLGLVSTYKQVEGLESGSNCNMSAEVACKVTDGSNKGCEEALQNTSYESCGLVNIEWTYSYCNKNEQKIYFHQDRFEPILHNEIQEGFDRNEMGPGDCRYATISRQINTCNKRNTVASLKLEGNLSGAAQGGENYCYAYAFLKQKVGRAPTYAIVESQNRSRASISLGISCYYKAYGSSNYSKKCSEIASIRPQTQNDCELSVQYKYKVKNNGGQARVQAIISTGNSQNLLTLSESISSSTLMNTGATYTKVLSRKIDICRHKKDRITRNAVAIAASVSGGSPTMASDSLTIKLPPSTSLVSKWGLISTSCRFNGTPCSHLTSCVSGEAEFTYNVKNTGFTCNNIEKATIKFGEDASRTLAIDEKYSCAERESCPGEVMVFSETRFLDTCTRKAVAHTLMVGIHTSGRVTNAFGTWSGTGSYSQSSVTAPGTCTSTATQLIFIYDGRHTCKKGYQKRRLRRRLDHASSSSSSSSSTSTTSSSGGATTTTTTTTTTTISHVATAYCSCDDYLILSKDDQVTIKISSKDRKHNYGKHIKHNHGDHFVVNSNDVGRLSDEITVSIYSSSGAVAQTVDVKIGGNCIEDMVGLELGSLTLSGFSS